MRAERAGECAREPRSTHTGAVPGLHDADRLVGEVSERSAHEIEWDHLVAVEHHHVLDGVVQARDRVVQIARLES